MVVAAIDAGTTGVRCMVVGKQGEVVSIARRSWEYSTPELFEIAKEFDPKEFWKLICTVVIEAIESVKITDTDLTAIATTSQRQGLVILNKDGTELHGAPNIDARGAMTQYVIEESLGESYHDITGCWPPLMFGPSRLAWFEEEEPDIFGEIAHVLPINDWITYRLCGNYVTEPAAASSTGFFDVRTLKWSEEIAEAVGVNVDILPEIHAAGEIVGEVTAEASKQCGLRKGIDVVQGSTDTHCALLALQAEIGELGVIAGSTTPIMLVLNNHVCLPEQRVWTGCHAVSGQWTLESNATMTGAYLDWVVGLLCEQSEDTEKCKKRVFGSLGELLAEVPPGSHETYAALGPAIMNTRQITDVKMARMVFPQPALPQVIPLSSANLIHAVLENIAYSVRGNLEQLEEVSKATAVKTIGGLTRSRTWVQILANVLDRQVQVPSQSEGSLLGAAICAAVGSGEYSSLGDASKVMVQWSRPVEPDERTKTYSSYYKRWREIWDGSE